MTANWWHSNSRYLDVTDEIVAVLRESEACRSLLAYLSAPDGWPRIVQLTVLPDRP